jgi:hypothetical protein
MKTILRFSFAILLTSVSTEILAQANTNPAADIGSNVPDPNSDEKAAQIQNTPFIIDDNGEKVYFLVTPSIQGQPIQQPNERRSEIPAKGKCKNRSRITLLSK